MFCSFKEILMGISSLSDQCWLYLPESDYWSLDSPSAVLESEEVAPDEEDDPNAGIPKKALEQKLTRVLPVSEIKDIVNNIRKQNANASCSDIFQAFIYYYDNDAYIILGKE